MDIQIMHKKARSHMLALDGLRREVSTAMQGLFFIAERLELPNESTEIKQVAAVRSAFARKQREMIPILNSGESTPQAISIASELLMRSYNRAVTFSETLREWAKAANNPTSEDKVARVRCSLNDLGKAISQSIQILPARHEIALRAEGETHQRPSGPCATTIGGPRRGLGE